MNRQNVKSDFGRANIFPVSARNEKRGFTLIELLVVIAIISLLVSILIPSLTKAKKLARQVHCLTKLKNIGAANFLHIEEYDGHGSIGVTNGGDRAGMSAWPAGQNPYDDPDMGPLTYGYYWCQSHDNPKFRDTLCEYLGIMNGSGSGPCKSRLPAFCPEFEHLPIESYTWRTSYAVNAWLGYNMYLGDCVEVLASTPMMMDGMKWYHDFSSMAFPNTVFGWFFGDTFFLNQATYTHDGTENFLFFDGHAENHEEEADVDTYRYDIGWTWYGNTHQR
jgi:prepilin-type N-terminal cleavage/methylation domain-containing protein/prepilin-type processing-associated H-X9-DG protein